MPVDVHLTTDGRSASVETVLPEELAQLWRADVLDVREHAGTTWLWAFPQLLLWPPENGRVTWLFSPVNDNEKWCGDLWGLDEKGNLVLVELKSSKSAQVTGDPFKDFVRYRVTTGGHFQARKLAQKWFDLYLKELKYGSRDCGSPRVMRGILDYSSRRADLCRWRHLYDSISRDLRGDDYRLRVLQALTIREERHNPPPHFVAFAVTSHLGTPPFQRDSSYRRLKDRCSNRIHCRVGYAKRAVTAGRVVIVSNIVDADAPAQSRNAISARAGTDSVITGAESNILWADVHPTALAGVGHGVEFWHRDVTSVPVAFVVGYQWFHEPGRQPITVRILKTPPGPLKSGAIEWETIVRHVKQAVRHFFLEPRPTHDFTKIGVKMHFNA